MRPHRLDSRDARTRGGAPRIASGRGGGQKNPHALQSPDPTSLELDAATLAAFDELLASIEWDPLPSGSHRALSAQFFNQEERDGE